MNLGSMWFVRLPAAWLLARTFGLKGVWIAMCGELIFRGMIFLLRFRGWKVAEATGRHKERSGPSPPPGSMKKADSES